MTRLVDKNKAGKTDPVEKQNISKVVWPVPARSGTTDDYWGWRSKPSNTSVTEFHYGVDVGGGGSSRDIVAIMDGTIVSVDWLSGRGNTVILQHDIAGIGKFYTLYQHLSGSDLPTSNDVNNGKKYKAGDKVANMGNTGTGSDIHLHFELMKTRHTGTYSLYSINPLGTYPDRDTRNTERPISPDNPQPFFMKNKSGNYEFNRSFDWNFAEPVPKKAQPKRFSHHSSYATVSNPVINSGEG